MKHGLLLFLSVANVLLSAGLQFVPLAFFGASLTVDIFVAAMMLPGVITSISAVVVTYSLVPQLAGIDPDTQGGLTRRAFVAVAAYLGVPTLALIALAPVWVPWTVPGFSLEATSSTVALARVSLTASLVAVFGLVLSARMQANSQFILNALAAVVSAAVAAVIAVATIGRFGIVAAAWSLVARSAIQLAVAWALHPPRIGRTATRELVLGRTALPLLASSSVSKLEPIVDRSLLSTAPPGVLTLFYLAQQIYGAMSQVAAGSILAHVLTRFSTEARQHDGTPPWHSLLRELTRATIVAVGFGLLLAAAVLIGTWLFDQYCRNCVSFLTASDLARLGVLLLALGGVWVFGLHGMVLSSYFYARGDTMTPSVVAVAGFVVAIALKIAGFRLGGAVGLAIATSLYFFSTSAAMFALIVLRRRGESRA